MLIHFNKHLFIRFWIFVLIFALHACGGSNDKQDCVVSTVDSCNTQEPEPELDTTPDTFSFDFQHGVEPGSTVTSEKVTVTGINTPTPVSIDGGEFAINDGAFTNTPATLENHGSVQVRLITSAKRNWSDQATLTVGNYSTTFETVTELPRLGFNLNGVIEDYKEGTKATIDQLDSYWARGFLDYYFFFDNDPTSPYRLNNSPKLSSIGELKTQGYKTIMSIKWDFKTQGETMPSVGTEKMASYKANLVELYDRIWSKVDIIIVGNEPFIESPGGVPSTAPNLVGFYEEMLKTTIEYRAAASLPTTPIYLGAFNRLAEQSFQDASNGLLALARSYPEVAGVDLHIHHLDTGFGEMRSSIEYALERIREDQKIISTEFSAMRFLKTHINDVIDATFAQEQGIDPNWKIYEYLNDVLVKHTNGEGISRQQWLDFVTAHPWYDDLQKDYLSNAFNIFLETAPGQFELATYGVRQQFGPNQVFGSTTDPWILNSIIVNRTVQPNADGTFPFNKYLHEDFKLLR